MNNERDYPLLKNAPPHDSPKFIDYLRENNVVVYEDERWIVIENVKYHTQEKPWLTAFLIEGTPNVFVLDMKWGDWNWLKKSSDIQTVKRFHLHIYK